MTILGPLSLYLSLAMAAPFILPSGPTEPPREAATTGADLDLVVLSKDRLARVRLEVRAGGSSLHEGWDRTFRTLFDAADRDGNGSLDAKEAERLPGAFALRQGPPYLNPGYPPPWPRLDRDGDGRARVEDVAAYYRSEGLGRVLVGIGRPSTAGPLNAALIRALDANGDGRIDEAESEGSARAVLRLDVDEDELIAPAELDDDVPQPASTAAEDLATSTRDDEPLAVIPPAPSRDQATARIVARLDGDGDRRLDPRESRLPRPLFDTLDASRDGTLDAREMAAWFDGPSEFRWCVSLDAEAPEPTYEVAVGEVRLILAATPGTLPENLRAAATRLRSQFQEADTNRDGRVVADEAAAPNAGELRRAIAPADRDGDAALSSGELDAWLAIQERVVDAHATLSIIDHGPSLFELLDRDRDGRLSAREIRSARARMKAVGALSADDRVRVESLPRTLAATLSRGRPLAPYQPPRPAPAWFLAMDRNHDGDISRREYLGRPRDFDRLDTDRDGLLDPREAAADAGPH